MNRDDVSYLSAIICQAKTKEMNEPAVGLWQMSNSLWLLCIVSWAHRMAYSIVIGLRSTMAGEG